MVNGNFFAKEGGSNRGLPISLKSGEKNNLGATV
jgi:hypothetical protein